MIEKILLICLIAISIENKYNVSAYIKPMCNRYSSITKHTDVHRGIHIGQPILPVNTAYATRACHTKMSMNIALNNNKNIRTNNDNIFSTKINNIISNISMNKKRILNEINVKKPEIIENIKKISKFLFPFILQLSVLILFSNISPVLAKNMNRSMSKGVSKVAVKMVKKRIPLWKKVLDGEY